MNTTPETPRNGGSESVLRRLTPERRAKLDGWLFEDKATYKEVMERCRQEFNASVTRSSLSRYRRSRGRERELAETATNSGTEPKTPRERYEAVLDGVERRALEMSRGRPEDVKSGDLANLVHLIIAATRDEAGHADHFWSFALALEAASHGHGTGAVQVIPRTRRYLL